MNNEFLTSYEKEVIINNISNDFVVSNIKNQLTNYKKENISISRNLMLSLSNNFSIAIRMKYPLANESIIEKKNEIFTEFLEIMKKSIGFDTKVSYETLGHAKFSECILSIYTFFVYGYLENHVNYFFNRIISQKKHFIKMYKNEDLDRKDPKLTSLKKSYKSIDNSLIILYFDEIFKDILNDYQKTFIEDITSIDPDEYTNLFIKDLFVSNDEDTFLTENFIKNYMITEEDDLYNEIYYMTEYKVRDHFLTFLHQNEE